jgi:hypothetical protein
MLLEEGVQTGVVVDRAGRLRGLLTVNAVIAWMRDERSRSELPGIRGAGREAAETEAQEAGA